MPAIDEDILKAYSRGEITRREIAGRLGEPVGFGRLLMELHALGLPLPRFPSDPASQGAELVRWLAEEAANAE